MFRVIDTLVFDDRLYGHYPEWRLKYGTVGVLACLSLADDVEATVSSGTVIRVYRPDGSTADFATTLIDRTRVGVGLFFPNLSPEDIPRSSTHER